MDDQQLADSLVASIHALAEQRQQALKMAEDLEVALKILNDKLLQTRSAALSLDKRGEG